MAQSPTRTMPPIPRRQILADLKLFPYNLASFYHRHLTALGATEPVPDGPQPQNQNRGSVALGSAHQPGGLFIWACAPPSPAPGAESDAVKRAELLDLCMLCSRQAQCLRYVADAIQAG